MNIRAVVAEGIGSFFLFACVIGSGIMATNLSQGNNAIALLGNTLATGAILYVLIAMLGPISGAHFNPAVSLAAFIALVALPLTAPIGRAIVDVDWIGTIFAAELIAMALACGIGALLMPHVNRRKFVLLALIGRWLRLDSAAA